MKIFRHKTWLRLCLLIGFGTIAGGGYYLTRYQIWPAYRTWSITRMNALARDFIAADDPRNALLTVRKVLGQRPNNAEAWRLGAKAADMRSSSEAVAFQRNLCRVENTVANQLTLIRLALKYQVYSIGMDSLQTVSAEANDLPEYHQLAAEIYRKLRREESAKQHLTRLLALKPGDRAAGLALAEVEFALDRNHLPADWVKRVDALCVDPLLALPARVLKLRGAVARRDASEAGELAVGLLSRSDLDLAARLSVVEAAYLYDPPAADLMLTMIMDQAASQPDQVAQIMEFLLGQAKNEAIRAWYVTLPESVRQNEKIKLGAAFALQAMQDWNGMEKLLGGARWGKEEPRRLALLACALRRAGRINDFSETWKLAVNATGQDVQQVVVLLRTVESWHWDEERYDLLWKLFNLTPNAAGVQDLLIAHEHRKGNTVNLNKIYARATEVNPGDENLRNNFAYTSLLIGANENRARQIAQELNRKHPDNVAYLTTYTFALHKQGLSRDALGLVEKLDASKRAMPDTMLHEAVYAAAAGEAERAALLLKTLPLGSLLPEERRLAGEAEAGIAGVKRLNPSSVAETGDFVGTAGGGWLALLPTRPFEVPADFKRANSYYQANNLSALKESLQTARWKGHDHLRYALLAFVERQQSRESRAAELWQQAFVAAGRELSRLRDLQSLTSHWNWLPERMAVLDRIFENESPNAGLPEELLGYYRSKARTSDLARLYWRYVERTNSNGSEAAWCVYYNLLCGMNVTSAQTLAERIHSIAPQDPHCRIAYAFSLWRQRRSVEAWLFVQDLADRHELGDMQWQLVVAGVLIDLGRGEDARTRLVTFDRNRALPEEITMAEALSRKIGLGNATMASTEK